MFFSRFRGAELGEAIPAPPISDLVADPAEMAARAAVPLYVVRNPELEGTGQNAYDASDTRVLYTTEADALSDFNGGMLALEKIFELCGGPLWEEAAAARHLRTTVAFVGQTHSNQAANAMATDWLNRVDRKGRLFIGITPCSGEFVCQAVLKIIKERDAKAAQCIYPFEVFPQYGMPSTLDAVRREGLVIPDDWSLSATQMKNAIGSLARLGIRKRKMEIQLIAGRKSHIEHGIGGVTCRACFSFDAANDYQRASVVAGHCSPDHGFRNRLDELYPLARDLARQYRPLTAIAGGHENIPYPLLYRVVRPYEPGKQNLSLLSSEEATGLVTYQGRTLEAIAAIQKQLRDAVLGTP